MNDLGLGRVQLALGMMAGLAVAGGIGGAILGAKGRSTAWLAAGAGTGVVLGGGVGYIIGRKIIEKALEGKPPALMPAVAENT